ncbi:MAG: hypothetical protein ACD_57C00112G0001, partial [uncultured bacterium]
MLNLNSIVLFSENPADLVEFYKKIIEKDPFFSSGDFTGFEAGSTILFIGPHENVRGKNKNPERVVLNFETDDVLESFRRIKALGTKVVVEPYHPQGNPKKLIVTFEDLDGNYFQLVSKNGQG